MIPTSIFVEEAYLPPLDPVEPPWRLVLATEIHRRAAAADAAGFFARWPLVAPPAGEANVVREGPHVPVTGSTCLPKPQDRVRLISPTVACLAHGPGGEAKASSLYRGQRSSVGGFLPEGSSGSV